ncbi:MAG: proton-conducting transporter membrane subunit [Mucinivorans sp.]
MYFEYYILLALLPFVAPRHAKGWVMLCAVLAGAAVSGCGAVLALGGWGALWWAPDFDLLSSFFVLLFGVVFVAVALHILPKERGGASSQTFVALQYSTLVVLYYSLLGILQADTIYGFLFYWELMSASAFVMGSSRSASREALHSAVSFIVMMHLGFFMILGAFLLLSPSAYLFGIGTMSITAWLLFAIGFMIKSAVVPFHFWLPPFYINSESWVTALMGGAVTNIGIYGLLRVSLNVGDVGTICWVMMAFGAAGAVYGAFRLPGQHTLKGLLSYSSIENIGLTLFIFGFGFYCKATGHSTAASYAFIGGFLQLVFHAVAKTLAYLSLWHIERRAGSHAPSSLGGLVHTMPRTSLFFALGAFSLMAMVPMAGFFSEFMIFYSFFSVVASGLDPIVGIMGVLVVAIVVSVSIFAFVRSLSVALLGVGRSQAARSATEKITFTDGISYSLLTMILIGGGSLIWILGAVINSMMGVAGVSNPIPADFIRLIFGVVGFVVIIMVLWFVRSRVMRKRRNSIAPTWASGCGAPSPEAQYTDQSFAREANRTFTLPQSVRKIARGSLTRSIEPSRLMRHATARLAFFQTGRASHYILHIVLFLALILLLTLTGVL